MTGFACGPRPEGADASLERLDVRVHADGPFEADVALPLSPGGSSAADWAANVTVAGGGSARLVETERGVALRVEGTDDAHLRACTLQPRSERGNGCCAEQYLDRRWSLPLDATQDAQRLAAHVEGAVTYLKLEYTAASDWCGADAAFSAEPPGEGWAWLDGQDASWCE